MEIRLFFKKDPIFHLLKLPKLIIFKKKFENPFSSGKILISSSKKEILGFRNSFEKGKFGNFGNFGNSWQGDTRLGSFGRTSTRCEKPFETRCPADVYKCIARARVLVCAQQAFHKVVWESGSSSCLSSLVSPHVRVLQNSWQINVRAFTTTSLSSTVCSTYTCARSTKECRIVELFGEIHSWTCEFVKWIVSNGEVFFGSYWKWWRREREETKNWSLILF